jgi:hypothetical protein
MFILTLSEYQISTGPFVFNNASGRTPPSRSDRFTSFSAATSRDDEAFYLSLMVQRGGQTVMKATRLLILATGVTLLLAACGSDSETTTTTRRTTTSPGTTMTMPDSSTTTTREETVREE